MLSKNSDEIRRNCANYNYNKNNPLLADELKNYAKKLWLPADKSILIEDVEKIFDFIKIEINKQPTDRSIQHFKTQIISYILPLAKQKLKSLK